MQALALCGSDGLSLRIGWENLSCAPNSVEESVFEYVCIYDRRLDDFLFSVLNGAQSRINCKVADSIVTHRFSNIENND